jgi:hypothetical protein
MSFILKLNRIGASCACVEELSYPFLNARVDDIVVDRWNDGTKGLVALHLENTTYNGRKVETFRGIFNCFQGRFGFPEVQLFELELSCHIMQVVKTSPT